MPFIPAAPTLDLKTLLARPGGEGLSWTTPGQVVYTSSARTALYQALQAWDLHAGTALLPAYLCASVITPFQRAGLTPRSYRVDRQLRADVADLASRLADDVRVLVVIHYLGFPQPELTAIAELCRDHGAYLIEDCAHALFSRPDDPPLGTAGDAAVYSLPKSLPVPDGGVLVLHSPKPATSASLSAGLSPACPEHSRRIEGSEVRSPESKVLLQTSDPGLRTQDLIRAARLILYALEFRLGVSPRLWLLRMGGLRRRVQAAGNAALTDLDRGWSPLTRRLVAYMHGASIVQARRANFRHLLERFPASATAQPLFDELPEGVCPLGFPLLVVGRDAWRDQLYHAGVMTRTYWDVLPAEVPLDQFPDAAYLRDHILTLPVHQSLRVEHLERIVEVMREA